MPTALAIEDPILFPHVPKAAGMSVQKALKEVYGKRLFMATAPRKGRKYDPTVHAAASGHYPVNRLAQICGLDPKKCRKIIVLRHPVSRVVSEYCFNKTKKTAGNKLLRRIRSGEMGLIEFASYRVGTLMHYVDGYKFDDFEAVGFVEVPWSLRRVLDVFGYEHEMPVVNVTPGKDLLSQEERELLWNMNAVDIEFYNIWREELYDRG